jgi:hypothetical protein
VRPGERFGDGSTGVLVGPHLAPEMVKHGSKQDSTLSSNRGSVPVHLTELGAELLKDMIDMYLEGLEDAEEATIQDDSLGDFEQLLRVCGGYKETKKELEDIRLQLESRGE